MTGARHSPCWMNPSWLCSYGRRIHSCSHLQMGPLTTGSGFGTCRVGCWTLRAVLGFPHKLFPCLPISWLKSSSQFCIQFSHSLLSKFILGNLVIQQAPGLAAWREIKFAKSMKSSPATAKQTSVKGWTAPRLDFLLSVVLQPHLTTTSSVEI